MRRLALIIFLASALAAFARAKSPALVLVQTISLPQVTSGMNHFSADAKRERFFLTAIGDKRLLVIDLKSGKVIHSITGYAPAAARFAPDLNLLCVSGGRAVTMYDGDSFEQVGKVDLQSSVDELQYDPRSHRLYAGLQDDDAPAIGVIDVPSHKLLAKIKMPAAPEGFVLEEHGTRLFANTPNAGQVTAVDCQKQQVVAEWKLNEAHFNYPAALDEPNHRLFIGCRKPACMLVLDTESGKVVTSVPTGGGADDMGFDRTNQRAYLSCGSGPGVISVIQQIDADHYQALPEMATAPKARNSLFVPELKRFYLAVPKQKDSLTELRAYEPR